MTKIKVYKKAKQIVSVALIALMMITFVPAMQTEVQAAPADIVDQWLVRLKTIFPSGSYFSANRAACTHGSQGTCSNCEVNSVMATIPGYGGVRLAGGWTCVAFARFVQYAIFKIDSYYASNYTQVSMASAQIGDFVLVNGTAHAGTFLWQDASYVYLYDSNYGSDAAKTNRVSYASKISKSGNTFVIRHPNNYNSVQGPPSLDTTAPTVSNLRVTGYDVNGYSLSCTVSDNVGVTRVRFPTKSPTSDWVWLEGTISGNTATCWVNVPGTFGGVTGTYTTIAYAYDAAGNTSSGVNVYQFIDRTPPVLSNAKITNLSKTGYTVTCTVSDNYSLNRVQFPTWTEKNGQDDLFSNWTTNSRASGKIVGNTVTYNVKTSDHSYQTGKYVTHIYAFDSFGNTSVLTLNVTVPAINSGWLLVDSTYYYYQSDVKLTGWQYLDKKWYYLNPSNGAMRTGWLNTNNAWYYMNTSGEMALGWKLVKGYWYYLDPAKGGAMATGWVKVNGIWYHMHPGGDLMVGWQKLADGKWYYFDGAKGGAMASGWLKLGGNWYYFHPSSGYMMTGWQQLGGIYYYFNPSSGIMATGTVKIGAITYRFNSSGYYLGYA